MAVCVYAHEHYSYWAARGLALPDSGAFAENFTTLGLRETDVRIGDRFEVGDAIVEVTQPRSPCYKIAARYGIRTLAVDVQEAGFTGFLLRVLREGEVAAGDELRPAGRDEYGVTVAEAARTMFLDKANLAAVERLIAVPALAETVRTKLERRLAAGDCSGDEDRLFGE